MDYTGWLCEQGMTASVYDLDELVEGFLQEMERGLAGKSSSLSMIPSGFGIEGEITPESTVAVIDAGGTHLRGGLVRSDTKDRMTLLDSSRQAMPGRDHEVSAEMFYDCLVDLIEPYQDDFDTVGFCFSYPLLKMPQHDGELLYWTKEIKIPGMVGTRVGRGLRHALEHRDIFGKKVVLLNDTVAALLSGRAHALAVHPSSYIGFILGTGTNMAYVEPFSDSPDTQPQAVNVESGGFACFDRNRIDEQLDSRSENPGEQLFEKAVSGVYIGELVLELLQEVVSMGHISGSGGASLLRMDSLSIAEISRILDPNANDVFYHLTESDREVVDVVSKAVIARASVLTAASLAAAAIKCGEGKDSAHPICICIEGSTYYRTPGLADQVQGYLEPLLEERGIHVRYTHMEDASMFGAAVAAMTAFNKAEV